ncbi:uncharacterized protein LOC128323265 [Hemicordylus capensis]|uniref:uncharacterized protein LOC128323265 n=1 Tax=Hemicordylus capensis TaxID=884348 RepID=UPI0023027BA1|nr:uncharacterized protein LOC128323265 [Hemicordylus capensis]
MQAGAAALQLSRQPPPPRAGQQQEPAPPPLLHGWLPDSGSPLLAWLRGWGGRLRAPEAAATPRARPAPSSSPRGGRHPPRPPSPARAPPPAPAQLQLPPPARPCKGLTVTGRSAALDASAGPPPGWLACRRRRRSHSRDFAASLREGRGGEEGGAQSAAAPAWPPARRHRAAAAAPPQLLEPDQSPAGRGRSAADLLGSWCGNLEQPGRGRAALLAGENCARLEGASSAPPPGRSSRRAASGTPARLVGYSQRGDMQGCHRVRWRPPSLPREWMLPGRD